MSNVLLGWPNRCDDATLSAGSWSTALPLTNLQTRQITQVARTSSALESATQFRADLGSARILRAVALVNHNLSADAAWQITLGTTAGGSDVYDSGSLAAWQLTFDSDTLEWSDAGWWEGITDTEAIGAPYLVAHCFSQKTARYLTVTISDTGNADGYVQIGRLFVGGGVQPTYNVQRGDYTAGWEDGSRIVEADSGAEWYEARRRRRVARLTWPRLSVAEGDVFHELARRAGTTGEVLYLPDSTDAEAQQRYGFLGRLRQLDPVRHPHYRLRSAGFELVEIL